MGGRNWCERVTFEVLCRHRPGDNRETHESIAGVPAEIRAWYLQNTSQKHCRVGQLVREQYNFVTETHTWQLYFQTAKQMTFKILVPNGRLPFERDVTRGSLVFGYRRFGTK